MEEKKGTEKTDAETITAVVTGKTFYDNIPSGSGIETAPEGYYIIGDDSPFLYLVGKDFTFTEKYALFDTSDFKNGRIPKPLKPDLESLATINYKNKNYLLTLGSGSSEARNLGYLIELPIVAGKAVVKQFSFRKLMDALQQDTTVVGEELLNIEGLAISDENVYLLQRALNKAGNVVLTIKVSDFTAFLFEDKPLPAPTATFFRLPTLQHYQAGFSGAFILDDKLFFTASIESAPNAILDGEVLGSYIGYIPLADLTETIAAGKTIVAKAAKVTDNKGKTYTGKIESLVVEKADKPGNYRVIAISDDDQGHSELLEVEFIVK
ncbi:hypothetical protein JAO76_14965 [Pontibacter sp. BT310]|uniref:Uncharacterized protein n=1 Tax=Pontibacter populi TaxID=890055 RepID=A0ABS6XEN8_9BACT|nr:MULTISPECIES: hypothetical protein [Pontibacter]MBJ6119508.1 hypothetical protein [Pontibacter sp. BT310]MBR0571936.1 hypothetical protein [Microvirga sp. STS03]MBW3366362.1 hypothetical protein [Pontibacter populi]